MCDDLTPEECPECAYQLPDEYEYDPRHELMNDDLWNAAKEGNR